MRSQAQWINNVKTTTLHAVPPDGQQGDARDSAEPRHVRLVGGGVGSPRCRSGIDGGARHVRATPTGSAGERVLEDVCRLDRPHRRRRAAAAGAAAAAGRRAQLRRHRSGTGPTAREYFHDAVASDKRNPTRERERSGLRRAREQLGSHERSSIRCSHKASQVTIPVIDREARTAAAARSASRRRTGARKSTGAAARIAHSNVMDQKGRLWNTSRDASAAPTRRSARRARAIRRPSTSRSTPAAGSTRCTTRRRSSGRIVDTCFGTFHLNFAHDADNTIWSGERRRRRAGSTRRCSTRPRDAQKAQGWAPLILDTNGNGKQDAWVEPDDAGRSDQGQADRYELLRRSRSARSTDRSGATPMNSRAPLVRVIPGSNPPIDGARGNLRSADRPGARARCYHAARHRRRRQRRRVDRAGERPLRQLRPAQVQGPLNGPKATGEHCDEGWTFYPVPGPNFKGNAESAAADSNYYTWVDKYDTLGLGKNVPIATGNLSDSLLFLQDGKWVSRACPTRWASSSSRSTAASTIRTPAGRGRSLDHVRQPHAVAPRRRQGHAPKAVKFQMRPDPLAK